MSWEDYQKDFKHFLKLEKSLSENTIEAYSRDIEKLILFLNFRNLSLEAEEIGPELLRDFLKWINDSGISAKTQARIISGLKAFFRFLLLEERIDKDPSYLIESPKTGRMLPDVLSVNEIEKIISVIDLSKPEGHRNKAIIEVLYGCGLRVSELTELRISCLYLDKGFIRIIGKGDKERLVPIGNQAVKEINNYLAYRDLLPIVEKSSRDILFLNRRGRKLTRVMVFTIIKELASAAGIKKKVSPHTFRHSFATHLVKGGADLRAVQEMLGHESILTTEIYTHLDNEYLKETILMYHPRSRRTN